MNKLHIRLTFVCVTAWGAVMPHATAKADSLGRLFFTPEQRIQLEKERARNMSLAAKKSATASRKESGQTGAEEAYSVLTVDGIVQKHGGPRTVWVNGAPQNADNSGELAPDAHRVTAPGKTQAVQVKVGQKLLLEKPPQPKLAGQKPATTDNEDD